MEIVYLEVTNRIKFSLLPKSYLEFLYKTLNIAYQEKLILMMHVYRVAEMDEHNLDEDSTCSCGTRCVFDDEGEMIIVHRNFSDGKSMNDEEARAMVLLFREANEDDSDEDDEDEDGSNDVILPIPTLN